MKTEYILPLSSPCTCQCLSLRKWEHPKNLVGLCHTPTRSHQPGQSTFWAAVDDLEIPGEHWEVVGQDHMCHRSGFSPWHLGQFQCWQRRYPQWWNEVPSHKLKKELWQVINEMDVNTGKRKHLRSYQHSFLK